MFRLTIGQKVFTRLIIVATLIIILVLLLWVLFLAFKRPDEIYQSTLFIFPRMYLNSVIVTTGGLIIAILAASFAAFAMVHYKFKSKEIYYTFILLSYMIPVQVLLIPLYIVLLRLKLLNTYFALIFPYATM